jgi:hypothetical protein
MNTKNLKIERAKERIKELKGFYTHLLVYILVNIFITSIIIFGRMDNGESFSEAFLDFGSFVTPFFWGIGLLFHALGVFSINPFFSKDWEDRQIKKYMQEDKVDMEKFK